MPHRVRIRQQVTRVLDVSASRTASRCFEVFPRPTASFADAWAHFAARHLLTEPPAEAVSSILREVGALANVDRAWMFEYDAALLRFRNTHEWCREGVVSHVEDLQDAPVTMIAWLQRSLVRGEAVAINDVTRLPRQARALQAEMLRQGDKSVLSVPVFHTDMLRACIGFDMTRIPRDWKPQEAEALAATADLIGLALYGTKASASGTAAAPPLLYLRRRGGIRGVPVADILGLRSARDYTNVFLADGSVILDTRAFAVWLGLVPAQTFIRIHRSAIVNIRHIGDVERPRGTGAHWNVKLHGVEKPWAVSRPYRQMLRTRLGI
jgi:DNA-binding LytR/AlgR family response regulator